MIQILFLLHLLSALPIVLSPPFQFCEEIIKIPKSENQKSYLTSALQLEVMKEQALNGLQSRCLY